jgi:hypothetical protein
MGILIACIYVIIGSTAVASNAVDIRRAHPELNNDNLSGIVMVGLWWILTWPFWALRR